MLSHGSARTTLRYLRAYSVTPANPAVLCDLKSWIPGCWTFTPPTPSKAWPLLSVNNNNKTNSLALSPQANYTDWATATCRRNLVPTLADRGVPRGQRSGSATVVNLSFLWIVSSGMLCLVALVRTLTRATRCNTPDDTILHSHRREKLKSYSLF
jgi:hypothetical protein